MNRANDKALTFSSLLTFLSLLLCVSFTSPAQRIVNPDAWRIWLEEYIGIAVQDGRMSETEADDLRDGLEAAVSDPQNLNEITREELVRLPFLNEFQIHHFIKYRLEHPPFTSLYDLKNVEGWDMDTIERFLPFVYVPDTVNQSPGPIRMIRDGKSELHLTCTHRATSEEKTYLGKPFATSFRWRHRYKDRLSVAFTAEKDFGEPFFNRYIRGYDAYSGHLMLRKAGTLETLILGDFRVGMGLGLILNQGQYGYGGNLFSHRSLPEASSIRPKFSTVEYGYMRGAGARWVSGVWTALLFASRVPHDATIQEEEGEEIITSLQNNGLHRTEDELARKNAIGFRSVGGEISFRSGKWRFGIEATRHSWGNRLLRKSYAPYTTSEYSYLQKQFNYGAFYRYENGNAGFRLYGEIARGQEKDALACVQGIEWQQDLTGSYKVLMRYISPRYWSPQSRSFTHFSVPGNEKGLFISAELPAFRSMTLGGYADIYGSPAPRYRREDNTSVLDCTAYLGYSFSQAVKFHLSHRRVNDKEALRKRHFTASLHLLPSSGLWNIQMQARYIRLYNYNKTEESYEFSDHGWSWGMKGDYNSPTQRFRIALGGAIFNTTGWPARLYASLPRAQYYYEMPFVYGRGYRLSSLLRFRINKHLQLEGLASYTSPTDLKAALKQFFFSMKLNH